MKKLIFVIYLLYFTKIYAVGLFPVPDIGEVSFDSAVTYNPTNERFEYRYRISSSADNVGVIDMIKIDAKTFRVRKEIPADFYLSSPVRLFTFAEELADLEEYKNLPFDYGIERVHTDLPVNWTAMLSGNGYLMLLPPNFGLDANDNFVEPDPIKPGETIDNLMVTGLSPPTLREVYITPVWRYVSSAEHEGEVDQAERLAAGKLQSELPILKYALGPQEVSYNDSLHTRTVNDIYKMIELGWIQDLALINQALDLLSEAKVLRFDQKGSEAKVIYQQVLTLMSPVNETQMRREVIDLISINIQLVHDHTPDTSTPPEYDIVLDPISSELEIGGIIAIKPMIINRARNNQEILTFSRYRLEVLTGPHAGLIAQSDNPDFPDGTIGYSGTKVGRDVVEISRLPGDDPYSVGTWQAEVIWTGGADYVISFFSPPYLDFNGAEQITVSDVTANIGSTDSQVDTITRYFLSDTPTIDPDSAFVLFERTITPLAAEQENGSGFFKVNWPAQFPPGIYYFAACTDAGNVVTELNEHNNCSFHSVEQVSYRVEVLNAHDINLPPNCDGAVASIETLWPPNHKFKKIGIEGVTDVDQDDVTINILSITQDEAVNSVSSGSTSPDGKRTGTPYAHVRAERNGTGDGRVYEINFTASDSSGNECTGSVNVSSVVHDQSNHSTPAVDSGQIYDSTQEF